ncbi:MAG: hypothetical protein AAF583_13480, partial [Pseudomonadota bacterium]
MKMMFLTLDKRLTEQIEELKAHYNLEDEAIILAAIQRDYIRMLDFKKAEAQHALEQSWLEPHAATSELDWRAPIGWSGLIVSASWAAFPSGRCF